MGGWLVTGANGFLGANAGLWLAGRDHRTGLTRQGPSVVEAFDDVVSADLLDTAALSTAVRSTAPDVILHTAAMASHPACEIDPGMAHRVNAEATGRLASLAEEIGAAFLYVSTDSVFDGIRGSYREEDPVSPFSVYGVTKLAGEELALANCSRTLVIRTNFFGWSPTGQRSILEFFVNALSSGLSVPGFTEYRVSSIYVQHLMEYVWALAEAGRTGIVHVAGANALSKYEYGVSVAEAFGWAPDLVVPTRPPDARPGTELNRDLSLNTDLLASWIGGPPPRQDAGILRAGSDSAIRRNLRRPS